MLFDNMGPVSANSERNSSGGRHHSKRVHEGRKGRSLLAIKIKARSVEGGGRGGEKGLLLTPDPSYV